jgi:hypothetical protein
MRTLEIYCIHSSRDENTGKSLWYVAMHQVHKVLQQQTLEKKTNNTPHYLRGSKHSLRLGNDIERKHIIVDVVGRVQPVTRNILGRHVPDALGHRGIDVGENLQRGAPVMPDLFEKPQPVLNGRRVVLDILE